jgi:hypothetical protein
MLQLAYIMALTQIEIPFVDNLDFGVGVDSMTSSPMGKVVQGEISGVAGALGAKVGFDIGRIRTTHELETKLNIHAKASYAGGPFANASARFDFAAASKIQTSSLFMSVTSRVTLATQSIDDPSLSPAAVALADNPQNFALRFGDMFVRGIGRGGLFIAVLQLDTSDEQTSDQISSELSGSYSLFSGEAKANLEKIQKDFRSDLSIKVYHEGGPVDLNMASIDDPVQLLVMLGAWLNSFAERPDQVAVPYFATLAPTVIANGPLPLNAADAEHAQDVLLNCARQRSNVLDGMNLMDAIIQSPRRYSFTAPVAMVDIRAASNGYQSDLELIASAASAAMNHPGSAKMPAAFALERGKTFPLGIPPTPMPELEKGLLGVLAARGQRIALRDPLLTAMREFEPEGDSRLGFDVGLGIAKDQTAWGPGKQRAIDDLPLTQKDSAERSAHFAVIRNVVMNFALQGAAVARGDARPEAENLRRTEPPGYFTLGFHVASALFANAGLGGKGLIRPDPQSNELRRSLPAEGIRGFDAATNLYMGKQ